MNTPAPLLCSIFIVFLLAISPCSSSSDECTPSPCNDVIGPEIKFPFRITGRQPERCGYPGFNLSCNDLGETIITLPSTPGSFVVTNIDYASQIIHIADPENCLSQRLLNISLAGSPFRAPDDTRYTILSCPLAMNMVVPCQGNMNKSVIAVPASVWVEAPAACIVVGNVSIPVSVNWDDPLIRAGVNRLELWWENPNCRDCGSRNKLCGFSTDRGLETACSNPPIYSKGIPRSAEYGIIVGAAIPTLLCIIGLLFCGCGKIKNFSLNSHSSQVTELPIIAIMELPPMPAGGGLDPLTIQSYPKMVLGESWQIPKPNDNNTCPICLSEYEAEEILRSIPDCNHYFHANCIDEWLGLNATCPLCRKSPEESLGTESHLSSSMSLSSTSPTSSVS